jgi:dolichol-phosphate mannosyltransferase
MDITIVVPTFNEAPNVTELIRRIAAATEGLNAEVVFVDDSTDDTPDVIRSAGAASQLPVRLNHRVRADGGLSGAVLDGIAMSTSEWCVVIDGDLQHPPEMIPLLLASGAEYAADIVVASRHVGGGSPAGLDNAVRRLVSFFCTMLTRAMFPVKLRNVTDPLTGFFAIRRSAVAIESLRPRGFKILLEVLARNTLVVIEEPFVFAKRYAGTSKASIRQGASFVLQLAALRFGRLSGFATVGAAGAVANLAIMGTLQSFGVWYLTAALIAAALTIVGNFVLLERLVFRDLRYGGQQLWVRFSLSAAFNGAEAAARTFLLWVIVEAGPYPNLLVQAVLIAAGFIVRFVYHSRIVYRPARSTPATLFMSEAPLKNSSDHAISE